MKFYLLLFAAFTSAKALAATELEMESLLAKPIDARVLDFKNLKAEGSAFLLRTAFARGIPLQTRWRAVTTMGRLNPTYFRKDLEKALMSREWFMRNAAMIALQTDARDHAVRWSARLLNDPALVVRTQAVRNLIQLDARETEPLLWQQMNSPKNFHGKDGLWVRVHLAEALARFAPAGRVKNFQRLLLDSDERLHKWAILGLENTTGFRMTESHEPIEVRRQKWLTRLGVEEI